MGEIILSVVILILGCVFALGFFVFMMMLGIQDIERNQKERERRAKRLEEIRIRTAPR